MLASTPFKVTPFPASDFVPVSTPANCRPLGGVLASDVVVNAPVVDVVSDLAFATSAFAAAIAVLMTT